MKKIQFTKTLWWSISNLGKYDEIIQIGLKKAIKYLFALIALMALIVSAIGAYKQAVEIQEIGKYLEENVPKFKIENISKEGEEAKYKLNIEKADVVILDDIDFINFFKNIVVINTNIKENEAINEYYELANEGNNCIIILEDNCIIVSSKYNPENNSEEGITKYTYSEVLNRIGSDFTEFEKKDLVGMYRNVSLLYYMVMYFINFFVILVTIFALDVVVLGIIALIIKRLFRREIDKTKIFSLSIYSLTLPIILYSIYLIINYFARFSITYFNIINMLIAFVYVIIYFWKNNKKDIA